MSHFPFLLISVFLWTGTGWIPSCQAPVQSGEEGRSKSELENPVRPGAWNTEAYFPLLRGKSFGLVCNHTATIGVTHLVDSLTRAGLKPMRLFAPEHGFRGDLPDGHHIGHRKDEITGLDIISLYGDQRKPTAESLADLDLVVFDIQDVGARFYTYLSTLHYVLEACAEAGIPVVVLDRPNPNGHYVDGPVLSMAWQSFVGMHPVPVVYGMTIGEYAGMICGEGWLKEGIKPALTVIPLTHYERQLPYRLPDRPSPNLPDMRSVWLYPSLCLLEGTAMSVGRGTDYPFQMIGHPDLKDGDTFFTPVSRPESTQPPLRGRECRGFDLSTQDPLSIFGRRRLDLSWILKTHAAFPDPDAYFLSSGFFDKLAGNDLLRRQIQQGLNEDQIRASWKDDLERFRVLRARYLLYPDVPSP